MSEGSKFTFILVEQERAYVFVERSRWREREQAGDAKRAASASERERSVFPFNSSRSGTLLFRSKSKKLLDFSGQNRTSVAMLTPLKFAGGIRTTSSLPLADQKPHHLHRRRRNLTITTNAVTRRFVRTLDGACDLEVLESRAAAAAASPSSSSSSKPPLLFIHGSGHAAWCWAENFMPYYSEKGFDTVAVSLRGRGKSGPPPSGAKAGGTLESHAEDVAAVAEMLVGEGSRPPIVVGHSFGGMVAQKYALRGKEKQVSSLSSSPPPSLLSGIALLNSVPPSGNAAMIVRIAKERGLYVVFVFSK